ncbi:hypothetical protein GB937_006769 [Aspergillus fischeri]|nr:hypothetical protein GB937_006769 [Aspergillus fischeri]
MPLDSNPTELTIRVDEPRIQQLPSPGPTPDLHAWPLGRKPAGKVLDAGDEAMSFWHGEKSGNRP